MKPNKSLDKIIDLMRVKQEKAYSLRNSQAIDEIEELAIELAAINFSLSYYQVYYEDEFNILEQLYKHECAATFMEEKSNKKTDGASDNIAKVKHSSIKQDSIANYTMYQYAKTYHNDVKVLIDTLRGRASTLKKERTQ
jgi:hypothetical protein